MPHYHFHVHNDIETRDEEGQGFADDAAARAHATEAARDIMSSDVRHGHLNLAHNIEVTDSKGITLFRVTFRESLQVEDRPDGEPERDENSG